MIISYNKQSDKIIYYFNDYFSNNLFEYYLPKSDIKYYIQICSI